jgi:Zn-dependent peptidase ImmA (M78 family)
MIPKKVKVAGIEYDVREVNGLTDKFNLLGQINYNIGVIELDDSINESRKEQTLVHEILHACFKEAGYDEHDEEMINRVSIVLYQVLKDNELCFKA